MDPFHERLARIGLAAAHRHGFALAGGYAIQAAGLLERPSEDVDLFTAWDRRDELATAVAAVVHAYRDAGLAVDIERQYDTFARLTVTEGRRTQRSNSVWTGAPTNPSSWLSDRFSTLTTRSRTRRAHSMGGRPPATSLTLTPRCNPARYTREAVLQRAERADRGFDRRIFADALGQANLLDLDDFAQYGITGQALDHLRDRFAAWRRELLDAAPPE